MQKFCNNSQVIPSGTCGDGDAHSGTEGNPTFRDAGGVIRTTLGTAMILTTAYERESLPSLEQR
jgi:hypothetical protein